jgi:hypothetical protein
LEKIHSSEQLSKLNYFLCYWGEHVFPIKKDKCEMIVEKVKKIQTPSERRLFIIVPPVFHAVLQEMRYRQKCGN